MNVMYSINSLTAEARDTISRQFKSKVSHKNVTKLLNSLRALLYNTVHGPGQNLI